MGPCCSCTRAGSRCRQVRAGGATAGEDLAGGLGSLCTLLDEQPEAAETARRGWGLGPWGTCAVECVWGGLCRRRGPEPWGGSECAWVCAGAGLRLRRIVGLATCLFLYVMYFSFNRKWQEANEKIQELQASQEARADHEQQIKVSRSVSGALWTSLWWP